MSSFLEGKHSKHSDTASTAKAPRQGYVWGVSGKVRRAMSQTGARTGEEEEMVSERERDRIA